MKFIAINGSPRKNWNTAQLLQEALNGGASVGAETEMINLYSLDYKGCISCFNCKKKGAIPCHCYMKDDLSPVLEKVLQADALFLGSPIYFGNVTGEMRSFLERLLFITMTYDDYSKQIFNGHIDVAFFYTMNVNDEYQKMYEPIMKSTIAPLSKLGGSTEYYAATNTLQFDDYSKYHAASFSEEAKLAHHKTQFPQDKQAAFNLGLRFASNRSK